MPAKRRRRSFLIDRSMGNGEKNKRGISNISKAPMVSSIQSWNGIYRLDKKIGTGAEALIYDTKRKTQNNNSVRIVTKVYKPGIKPFAMQFTELLREATIFSELNFVKFYHIGKQIDSHNFGALYATMEKLEHSLHSIYKYGIHSRLNNSMKLKYFTLEIAACLHKLHTYKKGYVHLDISPQNIMQKGKKYDREWTIIDGGCMQPIERELMGFGGKCGFIAPEFCKAYSNNQFMKVTANADVFSLGACILYVLAKGRSVLIPSKNGLIKEFYRNNKIFCDYTLNILPNKIPKYIQNINRELKDLLSKMLEYDPLLRISAAQVILHPFFNDLVVIEPHPYDKRFKQIKIKKRGTKNEYKLLIDKIIIYDYIQS